MYSASKLLSPRSTTKTVDKEASVGKFEDFYKMGPLLGTGAFADVFEATEIESGKKVAVKVRPEQIFVAFLASVIDKKKHAPELDLITEEVRILRLLRGSPRIVGLIDTYESPTKFYMVLELVIGGELFDKIVTKGFYSESDATHLIRQVLEGIAYCHARGVVHRDLKPENLLCESADADDLSDVKITDFGIAAIVKPGQKLVGRYGSPAYMAPEIIEGAEYGPKVDMWSLGVISFILLGGYPPFADVEGRPSLDDQITFGLYSFDEDSWEDVSDRAKDFISKLLITDPEKRMSAEQALQHPIFSVSMRGSTLNRSKVIDKIKRFNARRKFRTAVFAIMTSNRMHKIFAMARQIKEGVKAVVLANETKAKADAEALPQQIQRSLRLYPRAGRSVVLEKRTNVQVSSRGVLQINELPHHVSPSSFHVHSLLDTEACVTSLQISRSTGIAKVQMDSNEIRGKISHFQVFYEAEKLSCKISYTGVLAPDQTKVIMSGAYVISNDTGKTLTLESIHVHYAADEHLIQLDEPLVLEDGDSVTQQFLSPHEYNVSVITNPDVQMKIVLDNGIVLTVSSSETNSIYSPAKLPSGSISMYQAQKNKKKKPELKFVSIGQVNNLAEEKVERQIERQKSGKNITTIKRDSNKSLTKAHSVKTVRSKPSEGIIFHPSPRTTTSVPAVAADDSVVSPKSKSDKSDHSPRSHKKDKDKDSKDKDKDKKDKKK